MNDDHKVVPFRRPMKGAPSTSKADRMCWACNCGNAGMQLMDDGTVVCWTCGTTQSVNWEPQPGSQV